MSQTHPPIIILDFDGVILPSTGAKIALIQQLKDSRYKWNQEEIKKYQPIDLIRRLERLDTEKNLRMAYVIYSLFKDILPRAFDRLRFLFTLRRNFRKVEYKYAEFYPYVIPTLNKLSKFAIIGICTNSERNRILHWLSHYSISHLITAFTSRDDRKSYGVKPNPKILLYVLWKIKQVKRLKVPLDKSKIYFIGDNVSDVMTAKNAGVKSIAVLSGHSTEEELDQASPDYIIPSLKDIFSISDLSRFQL
jgi:phosphoglycolate phosphatase